MGTRSPPSVWGERRTYSPKAFQPDTHTPARKEPPLSYMGARRPTLRGVAILATAALDSDGRDRPTRVRGTWRTRYAMYLYLYVDLQSGRKGIRVRPDHGRSARGEPVDQLNGHGGVLHGLGADVGRAGQQVQDRLAGRLLVSHSG